MRKTFLYEFPKLYIRLKQVSRKMQDYFISCAETRSTHNSTFRCSNRIRARSVNPTALSLALPWETLLFKRRRALLHFNHHPNASECDPKALNIPILSYIYTPFSQLQLTKHNTKAMGRCEKETLIEKRILR